MAEKQVIAYFMHEPEMNAARDRLKNPEVTESYVLGTIDEAGIKELQDKGLVVQVLPDEPEPDETPAAARAITLGAAPPGVAEAAGLDPDKANYYLVRLTGPLLQNRRQSLEGLGVELLERIRPRSYTCRLEPEQVARVDALPFVHSVRLYQPEDTGPVVPERAGAAPPQVGPGSAPKARSMLMFDVRLHRPEEMQAVRAWLDERRIDVAGTGSRKIRVYLLEGAGLEHEIKALPEVAEVQQYLAPKLHNDLARVLLGIDDPQADPVVRLAEQGEGQIVGVADTGLDAQHPDFQGRIAGVVPLGREGDASDPHGHGTHVSGSVLGDGAGSQGAIKGVAPKAKLFFQSLLDADNGLGGLPVDLGELFDEAYQAGARIHNNSWGAATSSIYTTDAGDVDEFVAKRRDMLVVISAGNEGQAANRLSSEPGFVDTLSVGSPATAKNALTVGASRSSRTSGGLSKLTWGEGWPDKFPDAPIGDAQISGDPDALAAFSSRGPCDDRRIKPEVVAPGTDIASAKSSRAPLRHFWGAFSNNPAYAFMGGTSMAAPLVAGCAVLVREHYVNRQHQPSAALLKATLVNSTRWLGGADAVAAPPGTPNYHQGFGRIDMSRAIPNAARPALKLDFVDTWQEQAMQFEQSGQGFRFEVSADPGEELRITLAYTDLPARALQNNLNLLVEEPSGQKRLGNEQVPMSLHIPDPDNNVEIVRIDNPAGRYLIKIAAGNLLAGPQDFALVVTGNITSPLVRA